jgi:hypothetical protein
MSEACANHRRAGIDHNMPSRWGFFVTPTYVLRAVSSAVLTVRLSSEDECNVCYRTEISYAKGENTA